MAVFLIFKASFVRGFFVIFVKTLKIKKMDIRELRVGNYYHWCAEGNNYTFKVEAKDFATDNYKNFEQIPLTEEWLNRFGFVRFNHQWSLNDGSMTYHYELNGGNRHWQLYFNGIAFSINESKLKHHLYHNQYVHQLQNLYYAVTGEELKLKEDETTN